MKNRIKTRKISLVSSLLIVPLAFALMLPGCSKKASLASAQPAANSAGNVNEKEITVYQAVQKMPEFPGGLEAFSRYLKASTSKATQTISKPLEGVVVMQFVVDTIGKIRDVEIVTSVEPELDEIAKNIVENMPDWIPGEHKGEKVYVKYTLPLNLSLKNENKNLDVETTNIYSVVQKKPQFPGGNDALQQFLAENMQYPSEAKEKKQEGRVYVRFIVSQSGEISDVGILKGVSPGLDKEAVRLVESMPDWIPGERNDKIVNAKHTLPIDFELPVK